MRRNELLLRGGHFALMSSLIISINAAYGGGVRTILRLTETAGETSAAAGRVAATAKAAGVGKAAAGLAAAESAGAAVGKATAAGLGTHAASDSAAGLNAGETGSTLAGTGHAAQDSGAGSSHSLAADASEHPLKKGAETLVDQGSNLIGNGQQDSEDDATATHPHVPLEVLVPVGLLALGLWYHFRGKKRSASK